MAVNIDINNEIWFRLSGAVKNHGEGLQAMAGLIPDSAAEEGDESIKMQVTPFIKK